MPGYDIVKDVVVSLTARRNADGGVAFRSIYDNFIVHVYVGQLAADPHPDSVRVDAHYISVEGTPLELVDRKSTRSVDMCPRILPLHKLLHAVDPGSITVVAIGEPTLVVKVVIRYGNLMGETVPHRPSRNTYSPHQKPPSFAQRGPGRYRASQDRYPNRCTCPFASPYIMVQMVDITAYQVRTMVRPCQRRLFGSRLIATSVTWCSW